MLYYYNQDGRFQKESSREYKTEKGAAERLDKEGRGAVFDETGKMIISLEDKKEVHEGGSDVSGQSGQEPKGKPDAPEQAGGMPFYVQTTCDSLRIRSGAGKECRITGHIREKTGNKTNHAIVEEKNGWGRLENGGGWIELAFAKKSG